MQKFEYLTVSLMISGNGQVKARKAGTFGDEWPSVDLTAVYGSDGWEITALLPGNAPNQYICFFKRVVEAS